MWQKETFNFDRKKIVVYFERLENVEDKLNYLHWVKYEYLIRPPRIDCNVGLKPKFEVYIDNLRKSIGLEYEEPYNEVANNPVKYEDTAIEKSEKEGGLKQIPIRGLKKLAKEAGEKLIIEGKITEVLTEGKKDRKISSMVVEKLKTEGYDVTKRNENTISDYYRKFELELRRDKEGKLKIIKNKISR